ncbi:MAG: LysM peptidoglycan-binding domain-containing protein [Methylococcales bacterium]
MLSCSQKAAFNRSISDVDRVGLFGLSATRESDRTLFGNVGRPSFPDVEDMVHSHRSKFKTVWEHILSLYKIPPVHHPQVYQEMQWFLRNREHLDRVQQRAEPFLFEIVDQLEKQRIPGEFALLPIIESAFQPYAYSRAHASGIWQFIPSTGRRYGLQQDWWYDGRRDIYAATQAAIRYLRKLHGDFNGDWLLALAAYNCGEGAVQNAIDRNFRNDLPTDFWSLKLPQETRGYVPRLLAVSKLFADARRYGIRLRPIPDRPYFKRITVASQIDLKMAANLAGISLHKLYQLNPGYNQWASAPQGPHRLLIPMENAKIFSGKIDNLSDVTGVQWRRHRVNPGDSLESIAEIYGASVANIQKANNLRTASLETGSHVIVPLTDQELLHYNYFPNPNMSKRSIASRGGSKRGLAKRVLRSGKSRRASEKTLYTVRRGDTLSKIAKRYSVNSKDLAKWNRIGKRPTVRAGTKIAVWYTGHGSKSGLKKAASKRKSNRVASKSRKAASKAVANYTVKKGDSLTKLARRYNVSVTDLRKWNGRKKGKTLLAGQRLKIRK